MSGNNWLTFTARLNKELEARVDVEMQGMDTYDNMEDNIRVKQYLIEKYREEHMIQQKKLLMDTFDNQNFYAQCKEEWTSEMIRKGKKIYDTNLLPTEEKCKNYHFLTFNLPEEMDIDTRIYIIQQILKNIPIETANFEGVFEQRGETQWSKDGFHCHCIVRATAGNYKQQILKPLKDICKTFNRQYNYNITPSIMHHEPISNKNSMDVKKEYIRGRKKPDKMAKALNDKPMRTALNLKDIYDYHDLMAINAVPKAVILTSPNNDGYKKVYNKKFNGSVNVTSGKQTLVFN